VQIPYKAPRRAVRGLRPAADCAIRIPSSFSRDRLSYPVRERTRLGQVLQARTVEARLIQWLLLRGTAVVVGLYLLIEAVDPLGHVGGLRALVDLGRSENIPAWWNSLLMALVALTALIARAIPVQERAERRAWLAVGLAACALSLDEIAQPFSVFIQWAREMSLSAVDRSLPLVAIAGLLVLFWAWRRLPNQLLAGQLALSAVAYAAGAVVIDALNNLIGQETHHLIFAAGTLAEELSEMYACIVAVTAILDYLIEGRPAGPG
jgi:hypothetical protein